jgi:DNA-damage-inducible protein D
MTTFDLQEFESLARENGVRHWVAHEFMPRLGYETWTSFRGVVNKAVSLCARIGVDSMEAIIPFEATDDKGRPFNSYKLTRFGVLLVTMQADSKKPEVAQAQVALAGVADALVERYINTHTLERLERREELKIAENLLSGKAQAAGVQSTEFGIFKSAGFRGMYNMSLDELKVYKGASGYKGTLYDLMGITELAANTFRVTQTAERLKHTNASGLKQATSVAHQVGAEVRSVMIRSSGTRPEDLRIEEDLNAVKKGIKSTQRDMKKVDAKSKSKPGKAGGK